MTSTTRRRRPPDIIDDMKGQRRPDLEQAPSTIVGRRVVYGAEGCAGVAAEHDGAFLAILNEVALADLAPDAPGGGVAVYSFDSEADRDQFLAERCAGMTRFDPPLD
jgi:hypothetical protein